MDDVREVLKSYAIDPAYIEQITDRLFKVKDKERTYAVKRSQLTRQTVAMWEHVYHEANDKKIAAVLPVYLTKAGFLYITMRHTVYYLTPWIDEETLASNQQIERTYQLLGKLHYKTKQKTDMNTAVSIKQFKSYQNDVRIYFSRMKAYVETYEKNHYMSPFELQVCTQFHKIAMIWNELDDNIERLIVELTDKTSGHISLCHGQLIRPHIVHKQNTSHFINWEKAYIGHAIDDLSRLLNHAALFYGNPKDQWINQFSIYIQENKLAKYELLLLMIYLLDPMDYFLLIEQSGDTAMIDRIGRLEQHYRRLDFAWHMSREIKASFLTDTPNH